MSKAASQNTLKELHAALAQMFLDEIAECKAGGYPMAAADKNAIIAFLKNNSITAEPSADGMDKLKEEFAEMSEERRAKANSIIDKAKDDIMHQLCS